ncbi:MAG: ATP-dependent 6-phosphofructokinase [Deltaproteobacteria bacterium]|nr:ATP-dependent 6-phosphofructokinase [Deltaproteobacteria bacterium]MBW2017475.1 ATP-dependent 6-phosphofructokinase [Deltaproteobacteria bacterium]MBW2130288.1 ATP-dependent 6-phosphofructokinase [Deltaproteobacteria bacterium]MBW2302532.1 ATP-dependent 6-phosphofructokinase [Deltaproteobacteria bacterium]
MEDQDLNFEISRLGECRIPSPARGMRFVDEAERLLYHSDLRKVEALLKQGSRPPSFETAGPREKIYFDPSKLKCGIVTCGGLCPGLNDVIRALVLALYYHYGVETIFGFRYGYEGLSPKYGHVPLELSPGEVKDIHQKGGTILGSSRGPQDVTDMVDTLERMNVGLLFAIGGDGTLRGAQAISEEIGRRGLKIGVIGIPKTIDNDISYVEQSFGFETAVTKAGPAIYSAHSEATGARNGIGLVKLMGRESGFIAAYAALAFNDVNFCLVPEIPFTLEGFLGALEERLKRRGHAVIVAGEGAGQDLMPSTGERDASGNPRLGDIGLFLKEKILTHFKRTGMEITLKYIDPSYTIRSMPANPHDSAFCLLLAQNAVHAGMAGRTNMVVGYWKGEFTHVPIAMAVSRRRRIEPGGRLWNSVLSSTGQPARM